MAFRSNDRVKETSTSTGTGNLTLAGAVSGFQAFSIFANNDTFFYAVVHQTAAEWEVGIGTYVSATPALARTTVLESSNSDAAVSFSAGTKDVFVTRPSHCFGPWKELAADPAASEANWMNIYLRDNAVGPRIMTRDEYGLFDVISRRDTWRTRKPFAIMVGSDSVSTTDAMVVGINCISEGTIGRTNGTATEGEAILATTGSTSGNEAGFIPGSAFAHTIRQWNPDVTVKFRVNSTTQRRVWIGWTEADMTGSDSAPATHKFALRLSTIPAVTGFTIVHSDGTTEVVEAQIQASDTNVHTIRLLADDANSRFGYSFDGATVTWITTNIPAQTDLLGFQCQIETNEGVAKNMNVWWVEGSMEK